MDGDGLPIVGPGIDFTKVCGWLYLLVSIDWKICALALVGRSAKCVRVCGWWWWVWVETAMVALATAYTVLCLLDCSARTYPPAVQRPVCVWVMSAL
jgi:hypothetical protein